MSPLVQMALAYWGWSIVCAPIPLSWARSAREPWERDHLLQMVKVQLLFGAIGLTIWHYRVRRLGLDGPVPRAWMFRR